MIASISIKPIDGNGFVGGKNAAKGISITGTSTGPTGNGDFAGDTVTVMLNGQDYTGTFAANGTWSISVPAADLALLSDGENYTVTASATDKGGNSASTNTSVTVEETASVSIDPIDGDGLINAVQAGGAITITGETTDSIPTDLDGRAIKLTLNGQTYTGPIQSDGTWSVAVAAADVAALVNGKTYLATASVTDLAGNVASASGRLSVDETAAIAIKPIDGNGFINGKNATKGITITGTSTGAIGNSDFAGQTVTVMLNGQTYTGTIAANGTWSVSVSAADLALLTDGATYAVTASATDKGGNPASIVGSVTVDEVASVSIDPIDGNGFINAVEATGALTITGKTADTIPANLDGQTIKVTLNGRIYTGTIQNDGTWSVTVGAADVAALVNGKTYVAKASVTDLAGNVASASGRLSVDETAAIAIKPIDGNGFINGKNATKGITITGTSTGAIGNGDFAAQTVTVTLNGKIYTGAIAANGAWSVSVSAADLALLSNSATYAVAASATDKSGNPASTGSSVTVDETASVSINPVDGNSIIDAGNIANGIAITGTSSGGEGSGDFAGEKISVSLNGKTYTGTIAADGTWSVAIGAADLASLTNGHTYTVAAHATDAAGNSASTSAKALVDETVTLTINPIDGNNVVNAAEASAGVTISGTAGETVLSHLVGRTVSVTFNSKVYTGKIASDGTWSVTVPPTDLSQLVDGQSYLVTVSVTDSGGHPGSNQIVAAVHTALPTLSINPIEGDDTLTPAQAGSGFAVAGTTSEVADGQVVTVELVDASNAVVDTYHASVAGNAWSAPVAAADALALAGGTYTVKADVSDVYGNPAQEATQSLTVESVPTPVFDLSKTDQTGTPGSHQTQSQTVSLVGQTGAGDTVTLESTGQTTIANTTGGFQFDNVSLALGSNSLTVQASDTFGQTSSYTITVERDAASTSGNPVLEWNQATLQAIATDADAPTVASRALAMESLAVYDAISAINGTPGYLVNVTAPSDASADAAVAEAADTILDYLYPAQAANFDAQLAADLAAVPDGQGKTDGIALGKEVAQDIIAVRANDGSSASVIDNGSTAVGQWQPTAPGYANAVTPQWANVTPFALESSNQFLPAPPPALDSAAYAAAVNETQSLGAGNSTTRTADQTQIAKYWNDQGGTYTPPGQWNDIADQVAQAQGDSMAQDAQLLAELNVAQADSAIAAWNTKYTYNAWRPITAIQNANEIGNPGVTQDSSWTPLITTPAFPEYVAGHAVFSQAAAQVLDSFFGSNYAFSYTDPSLGSTPGITRSFTSFDQAAQEAGMSRIYGGIHFSFSVDAGWTLGQQVGDWTLQTFNQSTDTVPPKIVLNQASGLVTNTDPTITGEVTDNLSGVASLAVSIDGGPATNVSFDANGNFSVPVSLPTDGSADGQHTLTFTAVDAAGNVTSPLTFNFTLDTQAPQIALASASVQDGGTLAQGALLAGAVTTESGVALTALSYAFDGGTAMSLGFDSGDNFSQTLDLSSLSTGDHTLTLTATDAAGNTTTDTLHLSLPAEPLLTIADLTPMMGASDVGVTYRPKVTFSRAINPATLTSSSFFATDSTGAVVPGTILPTTDASGNVDGGWLLFTNPLPGASTITLHVEGDQIQGTDGSLLDAAGTGTAGSDLTETFTTVSTAPVANTTISGIVVDPGPDMTPMSTDDFKAAPDGSQDFANDTWKLPIAGVKVYVLGDEQDAVYTDAQGQFTLSNVPTGDVKVVFDGTTATNSPAGFYFPTMTMDLTNVRPGIANTVMGSMGSATEQAADATDPAVYLPRIAQNILTPVSDTQPTTVTAPANTDFGSGQTALTAQQLSELTLTVQPGSVVDANGNPVQNPQVGISPVPPSIVQDMLPPGLLQHTFDITIQAPGSAVFTQPATLTMPNVLGLPPGAKTYILSFDHTTGMLVIDGTATVSADGLTVVSDPGSGVTAPGWHGFTPEGSPGMCGDAPCDQPPPPDCSALASQLGQVNQNGTNGGLNALGTTLAALGTVVGRGSGAFAYLNGFALGADLIALAANPSAANLGKVALDAAALTHTPLGVAAGAIRAAWGAYDAVNDFKKMEDAITKGQQIQEQCNSVPDMAIAGSNLLVQGNASLPSDPIQIAENEYELQQPLYLQMSDAFSALGPLLSAYQQNPATFTSSQINDLVNQINIINTNGQTLSNRPWLPDVVQQAVKYYSDQMTSTTDSVFSIPSAGNTTSMPSMGGPSTVTLGTQMFAALQSPDGNVQRFVFNPTTGINYFLSPNTFYSLTIFDPTSLYVGTASFVSSPSGSTTAMPTVGIAPDTGTAGADGLTSTAAYVVGVDQNKPDNLVPGMTDLAALQAGLINGDKIQSLTGVVGSVSLQGEAQAIVLGGSTSSRPQQTAYIATGSYGLAIVDVSSFQSPQVLSQIRLAGTASAVAVDGVLNLAAVADGNGGLQIINIADPTKPQVVQSVAIDATAVQVFEGTAYVNDGSSLDAIDLSTGDVLQVLSLAGAAITGIARDGSMLYIMDASNTLSTVDVSSGTMVKDGSITLASGGGKIFAANGVVYVPTNNVFSGGYSTVDVSNPSAPKLIEGADNPGIESGAIALNGSGLGVAVGKDGGGPNGVVALDVVDTSDPTKTGQFVTRYTLPVPGGNNAIEPFDVAIGDGIAFVAAGTGGLQVVNYKSFDTQGVPPTISNVQVVAPTDVLSTSPVLQVLEGTTLTLSASVTDDVQVRNVEVLINGQAITNSVGYPWNLTAQLPTIAANGSNQVTVQVEAIDTGGNTTISTPITIQLARDTTPPTLVQESISEGEIRGQSLRSFVFDFSKPLNPSTVTASTFELLGPGNVAVSPQSIQVRNQEVEVTYATLPVGSYQYVITAANVTDNPGNPLGTAPIVTDFTIQAFTDQWINPNGGYWSTATNWSAGAVPGAADDVLINLPLGSVVDFTSNDSIERIVTAGGGTLSIDTGTLTVNSASDLNGKLAITGGTFAPNAATTITNLAQTGGTLGGTGVATVTGPASFGSNTYYMEEAGGGTTDLQAGATLSGVYGLCLDGSRVLQNDGTFDWTSSYIYMGYNAFGATVGGSTVVNSVGASFDDAVASGIYNNIGTNAFNNAGLFETSFAAGTTSIYVSFNNTGTVQVGGGGTLYLNGGGTSTGGTFAGAGTLQFNGSYAFAASSTISTAQVGFSAGLTVGDAGTATLTIDNGSAVSANFVTIGNQLGSNGTLVVTGPGTTLTTSTTQNFQVGVDGTASLTIENQAAVTTTNMQIAFNPDAAGDTLDINDATLTVSNYLGIGNAGSATVTIEAGGVMSVTGGLGVGIADSFGSTANVTVTGVGSQIKLHSGVDVGYGGNGSLNVAAGAVFTADFLNIGHLAGSQGTVDVTGPGSSVNTTTGQYQNILDGFDGTASLTIENQATATTTYMEVAVNADAGVTDSLNVDDATLTVNQYLTIAGGGSATATVSAGGIIDANAGITLANSASSVADLTVSGPGSEVKTEQFLVIGQAGSATVMIEAGGVVEGATGIGVGNGAGSVASVTVTGAGSELNGSNGGVSIGFGGSASVTVENGAGISGATVFGLGSLNVSSGGTNSGTVVSAGGQLSVFAGGVDSNAIINGGTEQVFGVASNTTIKSGGAENVGSGGAAVGAVVSSGATLTVSSGGTTSNTVVSAGGDLVVAGGTDLSANIKGGQEQVYGSASGTTIQAGAVEYAEAGGTVINAIVSSGGTLVVSSGGSVDPTLVSSGGVLNVSSGGVADGTNVEGILTVSGGGTVSGTVVSSGGELVVSSGGTASGTVVLSGGMLVVSSGGIASGTTFASGAVLEVLSGEILSNYVDSGGITVEVASGGTAIGTTLDIAGTLLVLAGGSAGGTVVSSGGIEVVSGLDSGASINSGGSELAISGGIVVSATVSSGGVLTVEGGTVSGGVIDSGGAVIDSGGFGNAVVTGLLDNGALVYNLPGHGARSLDDISGSGTVEISGGDLQLALSAGSTFTGEFFIDSGGTLELTSAGAAAGRPIDFTDIQAVLRIDGTTMPTDVVSGFVPGARFIDLAGLPFSSGGSTIVAAGNVLQVMEGGTTESLNLDPSQSYTGQTFELLSDDQGGTLVGAGQIVTVASGSSISNVTVSSGVFENVSGSASGVTVLSGGTLVVFSGASASGTVLSQGLEITYGTDSGAAVSAGGLVWVESSGTQSSATVTSDGSIIVSSGGVAAHDTIASGGQMVVSSGTADFTFITGNGPLDNNGGDVRVRGGTMSATTVVSGGNLQVSAGGTDIGGTIGSGGFESVSSGGSIISATVIGSGNFDPNGGGLQLRGGTASSTVISSGGNESVKSGGQDFGATVLEGGGMQVSAGGLVVSATIVGSGNFDPNGGVLGIRGGTASASVVSSGGTENVRSGGTDSHATILAGGQMVALSGGVVVSATIIGSGNFDPNGGVLRVLGGSASASLISSGGLENVRSGGTDSGATILSGGQMNVLSGGTSLVAKVSGGVPFDPNGGRLTVVSAGVASGAVVSEGGNLSNNGGATSGATISSGGAEYVTFGGTDTGATVFSGGQLNVSLGAASFDTISSGGVATVSSGGVVDSATTIGSGDFDSGGGNLIVGAGGTAISTTVSSGGNENVSSGGADFGATVSSGGELIVSSGGAVTAATVIGNGAFDPNGGTLHVWGGVASADVVSSGGIETVNSGGIDYGATVLPGGMLVVFHSSGTTAGTTVSATISGAGTTSSATEVLSGGIASDTTTINTGKLIVRSGGIAIDTFVDSGTGLGSGSNGGLRVSSGGAATGTIVNSGGEVTVFAGGSDSLTIVSSGGAEIVSSGGIVYSALVVGNSPLDNNGGALRVRGGTASGVVTANGGSEFVSSGGMDYSAIISSGGFEAVSAGGTAISATVLGSGNFDSNGGTLSLRGGTASSTVVSSGGDESIKSGGSEFGATVLQGGSIQVSSGGSLVSATVEGGGNFDPNGGSIAVKGGTASGTTVSSGGHERVSSGGTESYAKVLEGAVLAVSSGGTAVSATVMGNFAFDPNGGLLALRGGTASGSIISAGATEIVSSGSQDFGGTVSSGGFEIVSAGGAVNRATVIGNSDYDPNGGTLILQGGKASGNTMSRGGFEAVSSGSIDSGATILSGGDINVYSGGTAVSATVVGGFAFDQHGGALVLSGGVASGTVVSNGGILSNRGGAASGSLILSGGVENIRSGGTDTGASIMSGGEINVSSGTTTADTISMGGFETISSGGTASAAVDGGTETVLSGGTAVATAVNSGGLEFVSSGGTISGATISGGIVELAGGELDGSVPITFVGTGGLVLDAAETFSGVVAGFGSASLLDTIDLKDIPYTSGTTSAVYVGDTSSGTLTVNNGLGTLTANIQLIGDYTTSNFILSSDGSGGTLVIDPPTGMVANGGSANAVGEIGEFASLIGGGQGALASVSPPSGVAAPDGPKFDAPAQGFESKLALLVNYMATALPSEAPGDSALPQTPTGGSFGGTQNQLTKPG